MKGKDIMNECELVQDLLIGYNDKTLNEFSKKIVEEHLKQCEICKKMLEEINDDKKINENSKEIDYLKKIRKKDNKKFIYNNINNIICFHNRN